MSIKGNVEKLEKKRPKPLQAQAVLHEDEELTGATECHYWVDGHCIRCSVDEFNEAHPGGKLIVFRVKYV